MSISSAIFFGDILSVGVLDLWLIFSTAAVVVAVLAWQWRNLLAMTINRDLAAVEGVPVERVRLMLLFLLAGVIAVGMKIVGMLLVVALVIIPAAAARRMASTPEQMAVASTLIGIVAVTAGPVRIARVERPGRSGHRAGGEHDVLREPARPGPRTFRSRGLTGGEFPAGKSAVDRGMARGHSAAYSRKLDRNPCVTRVDTLHPSYRMCGSLAKFRKHEKSVGRKSQYLRWTNGSKRSRINKLSAIFRGQDARAPRNGTICLVDPGRTASLMFAGLRGAATVGAESTDLDRVHLRGEAFGRGATLDRTLDRGVVELRALPHMVQSRNCPAPGWPGRVHPMNALRDDRRCTRPWVSRNSRARYTVGGAGQWPSAESTSRIA